MGVVLYRRLPTQRLMTTAGTTPFQARKTRLSGTCHPVFTEKLRLTALRAKRALASLAGRANCKPKHLRAGR
jgi:hypothetical protein